MTNLRKIRKSKKMTQIALSKKLKVTSQCVSITEKRGIVTLTAARRYAKALECSPLDLMDINTGDEGKYESY